MGPFSIPFFQSQSFVPGSRLPAFSVILSKKDKAKLFLAINATTEEGLALHSNVEFCRSIRIVGLSLVTFWVCMVTHLYILVPAEVSLHFHKVSSAAHLSAFCAHLSSQSRIIARYLSRHYRSKILVL